LIFSAALFETFFIIRIIKRDIVINVKTYPLFLSDFNEINFLGRFSKKADVSNLIKISPVGAELFHADRRTDGHDEATSRF
jgi:hypothetical protein